MAITSKTGLAKSTPAKPVEGNTNPTIRGTVSSPLQSDELSHIRAPSPKQGDRSMWPRKGDSGTRESAQAR